MEYMALYRKWRPGVFADVIGQEHITKVLCSEIEKKSVSHAYLFCGSRGTGKTTCAKILAKAVNCENPQKGDPCGKCKACLAFDNSYDILEMDAASNNKVEDIRDLCEKVGFMPIEMKKRVYIIDEVHMLSTGAFNALLKTLEEPPSHVMFILATTELNKIPATILSRCKRFDFHRISPEDMLPRLKYISEKENIGITDDALRLVAFLATGAIRDALSMLELFVGKTGVDRDTAAQALGVVGNAPVLSLLRSVAEKNTADALLKLDKIYNASKDMGVLCSELAEMFRGLLVVKFAGNAVSKLLDADPDVINTLRDTEDMFTKERLLYSLEITEQTQNKLARSGLSRRTLTELMVVKLCDSRMSTSPEAILERVADMENKISSGNFVVNTEYKTEMAENSPSEETNTAKPVEISQTTAQPVKSEKTTSDNYAEKKPKINNEIKTEKKENNAVEMLAFGELLEEIKEKNKIAYSMLADSFAEIVGDTVKIHVSPMGFLMLSDDKEKTELIASHSSKLLGMPVKIAYVQSDVRKKDPRPDLSALN